MDNLTIITIIAIVTTAIYGLGFMAALIALVAIRYKQPQVAREAAKSLGGLTHPLTDTVSGVVGSETERSDVGSGG